MIQRYLDRNLSFSILTNVFPISIHFRPNFLLFRPLRSFFVHLRVGGNHHQVLCEFYATNTFLASLHNKPNNKISFYWLGWPGLKLFCPQCIFMGIYFLILRAIYLFIKCSPICLLLTWCTMMILNPIIDQFWSTLDHFLIINNYLSATFEMENVWLQIRKL